MCYYFFLQQFLFLFDHPFTPAVLHEAVFFLDKNTIQVVRAKERIDKELGVEPEAETETPEQPPKDEPSNEQKTQTGS